MAPLTTSCSEIDMSVTGNWARDMEKVPSTIQMAANTKETGKKTSNMVLESSLTSIDPALLKSGLKLLQRGSYCLLRR